MELLLLFGGFAHDDNGVFWSHGEILSGAQKHGLRFLQEEESWFAG